MAKQIARLLKADMGGDLREIAKMLSKKGRGGDTMLAHITPKEAKILKEAGGAGTVNPDTGLLEFYDWSGAYGTTDPTSYDTYSSYTPTAGDWTGYSAPDASFVYNAPVQSSAMAGADFQPFAGAGGYTPNFADIEVPSDSYTPATPFTPEIVAPAPAAAVPPVSGVDYSQLPYVPFGEGGVPAVAGEGAITPTQPALSQRFSDILSSVKAGGGDVLDYLKKNPDLIRLAGAGAGAVAGRAQAQQAAKQIQQATQEQKDIGKPYRETGKALQDAALRGELTPQSAQAMQALRAQMAQGIEARGGVGVAQAQAQMEAFRQNLLQNQYNFGLQVSQIGDNMALGAIRTGMQLDQQLAAANQQFYTQLAAIAGGGTYGYQPPTRTTGA